nr:hypothetical protein [Tanacetum cinerariifolium]
MATTIDQQVALDESLVPSTQRLRIGRSNFRLPSDIQSKESTLQVVCDVLWNSPFFWAFQVTADVLEIYMQEFWATAKLHHNSIRFKMDTKKSVLDLEAFREMLHITPKPKASARKKKGNSASSTTLPTPTPTTTVVSAPRLSAIAKDAGTGSRPGVPDVPSDDSEEELSWNSSDDEDVDEQTKGSKESEGDKSDESDDGSDDDNDETIKAGSDKDNDDNDDKEELAKNDDEDTESGKGGDEVNESERESDEEETRQEEEESFDPIPQELRLSEEARIQEEEADELYRDVNINQGRGLQVTQNIEDSHVTLTPVQPDGPQESSSMSSFVTSMLNPISDVWVESIFTTASSPIVSLQTPTPIMTPSTIATGDAPIPPTTIPSIILKNFPTFNSAFRFDERLRSLETTFSEYRQTNPFVDAVSAIPGIVHQYMTQQMTEAVREAVQIQTDQLQDSLQRENDEFLRNIDENIKKIIKGQVKNQVKEQVSRILPRIEESVNATLEAEVLTRSSHSSRTSYAIAADLSEMELKKILIEKMEGNKSIQESTILKRRREDDDQEGPSAGSDRGSKRQKEGEEPVQTTCQMEEPPHPVFETGADDQPIVQTSQHPEWFSQPRRPPSPDRNWNKTLPAAQGDAQSWISDLARQTDARSSFNELLDTPIDFSNFIMNWLGVATLTPKLLAGPTYELMRGSCTSLTELEYYLEELKVDTLTPELLAGPTYELMKGSCKSLVELEYHLEEVFKATTDQLDWVNPEEEVYKATTDQLDWVNPEGQQYPHDLLQPLPLIPNNRGCRVIPFEHFISSSMGS